MSCLSIYTMGNEHRFSRKSLNSVGIVSDKPKVGSGNGSSHTYHSHFSEIGFAGACYMAHDLFVGFIRYLTQNSLIISANILSIRERDRNIYEARFYHLFFKSEADIFVFKTYLADAPDEWKVRQNNSIIEPYLYSFR